MSVKLGYNSPTNIFLRLLLTKDYIIDSLCIYSLLSISVSTDLEIHRPVTILFLQKNFFHYIILPNEFSFPIS